MTFVDVGESWYYTTVAGTAGKRNIRKGGVKYFSRQENCDAGKNVQVHLSTPPIDVLGMFQDRKANWIVSAGGR